jgi:hypothetical protein
MKYLFRKKHKKSQKKNPKKPSPESTSDMAAGPSNSGAGKVSVPDGGSAFPIKWWFT